MTSTPGHGRPVRVDVWSDVSCPWRYIGKRTFDTAVAQLADDLDVDVTYHSYQVSPDAPNEYDGSAHDFLVHHKGIPAAQVDQSFAHVGRSAAAVGLGYHPERLRASNTRAAHELLHHAKAQGAQSALLDRLFAAYFVEGRSIGRHEVLAELAADVGLDAEESLSALSHGTYAEAVAADIDAAHAHGISGVPFYVVDGRLGVAGVQSPEAVASLLRTPAR